MELIGYLSRKLPLTTEQAMEGFSAEIETRMLSFYQSLGERDRRRYAALEATKLGHGGIAYIAQLLRCDPKTIEHGKSELDSPATPEEAARQRKKTAAARRRKLLRHKSLKTSAK